MSFILKMWPRRAQGHRTGDAFVSPSVQRMAVVEWDEHEWVIREVSRARDRWEVIQSFNLLWSSGSATPESAAKRSERLAFEFAQRGIEAKAVLVSIPVGRVITKRLEVNSVNRELLANAIGLQVEAKGIAVDDYVVDFVAQPKSDSDGVQHVFAAAVPRAIIDEVRLAMESANLDLLAIGISEFALSSDIDADSTGLRLLVASDKTSSQLIVTHAGLTVASMGIPFPDDSSRLAPKVNASIKVLLQSLPATMCANGVSGMFVTGSHAGAVVEEFAKHNVTQINKLEIPNGMSLRCWGLLNGTVKRSGSLDFAHPRKSPDKQTLVRKRMVSIGVRAAMIFVLLGLGFASYLISFDRELATLQKAITAMESRANEREIDNQKAMDLANWDEKQIDWSGELASMLGELPGNDRLYLEQLRVEQGESQLPEVQLRGVARGIEDALTLNGRLLRQSPRYLVRPDQIEQLNDDPHYQVRFVVSSAINNSATSLNEAGDSLP